MGLNLMPFFVLNGTKKHHVTALLQYGAVLFMFLWGIKLEHIYYSVLC